MKSIPEDSRPVQVREHVAHIVPFFNPVYPLGNLILMILAYNIFSVAFLHRSRLVIATDSSHSSGAYLSSKRASEKMLYTKIIRFSFPGGWAGLKKGTISALKVCHLFMHLYRPGTFRGAFLWP